MIPITTSNVLIAKIVYVEKTKEETKPTTSIKESYTMYEDDGISFEFEKGVYAKTKFSYCRDGESITVRVGKKEGSYELPSKREYHIEIYTEEPKKLPDSVYYDINKKAICFTMREGEEMTLA